MKLDDFIYIISELNNGTVISGENNEDTEILLEQSNLKLYNTNYKYYFLTEYNNDYNEIEKNIKNNQYVKEIKSIRPNNSYLILFYKIECFNEEISRKIIQIEENEFFYKKYVFYYTESEFEDFIKWFNQKKEKSLSSILNTEECLPESAFLYMQFFLRLIIKIPFLKFELKNVELENFDYLLNVQLDGIRQNKADVRKIFNRLTYELDNHSVDEISEILFSEIIGGVDNENQIN